MRSEEKSTAGEYRETFALIRQTGKKWWEENKGGERKICKADIKVDNGYFNTGNKETK